MYFLLFHTYSAFGVCVSTQGPLPLRDDNGIVLLGERAAKCRAYAKALHYKELEFQKGPTPAILESLIRYDTTRDFCFCINTQFRVLLG